MNQEWQEQKHATWAIVAERDGVTLDKARVLIEMWAWPLGLALVPAYEKARDNHPDWQTWVALKRDDVPSLTEWLSHVEAHV